jgi:hypothetical protein
VRAQKCAGDIERLLLMQLMQDVEYLQLALPIEAVAALRLERRGPMGGELLKVRLRAVAERTRGGAPKIRHGGANSAARARDLRVRFSRNALLVFCCAARGKNQVSVRINKAGKDHAAAKIQFLGAAGLLQAFDAAARADRCNSIAVDQQRAIANQT